MPSFSTKLPQNLGPIHFIGIGGIGMSGIADVLLDHGYTVHGSDLKTTDITRKLAQKGATIFSHQIGENVLDAHVVVVSSAIKGDNPELMQARKQGLPVVRRADMLAELMRLKSNIAVAGTHGKTTTTTLVAAVLDGGNMDPTVVNGGIIQAYGSNAYTGAGEWMVVEADESDGSFNRLPATISVVTNIDPEHMEHWKTIDALHQGFLDFTSGIPFYGLAVCCIDDPDVQTMIGKITDRRIVTYGFNSQADVRVTNLTYDNGVAHFDVVFQNKNQIIENCTLPMPGDHNVSNALAAIAIGDHLNIDGDTIRTSLAQFKGVKRRFTHVGKVDGITIIDDYGHHPVEISAVLKAARQATKGRIIAIHQPHRYTRLSHHFDDFCTCFNNADVVAITDIFAAGEPPIEGASRDHLVTGLVAHGHRNAHAIGGQDDLAAFVREHAQSGDMVICLGAGSISAWANDLPAALAQKT